MAGWWLIRIDICWWMAKNFWLLLDPGKLTAGQSLSHWGNQVISSKPGDHVNIAFEYWYIWYQCGKIWAFGHWLLLVPKNHGHAITIPRWWLSRWSSTDDASSIYLYVYTWYDLTEPDGYPARHRHQNDSDAFGNLRRFEWLEHPTTMACPLKMVSLDWNPIIYGRFSEAFIPKPLSLPSK